MRKSRAPSGDPRPPETAEGLFVLDGCAIYDIRYLGILGDILAFPHTFGVADVVWFRQAREMEEAERRSHERLLSVVGLSPECHQPAQRLLARFPKLSTEEAFFLHDPPRKAGYGVDTGGPGHLRVKWTPFLGPLAKVCGVVLCRNRWSDGYDEITQEV